MPSFVDAFCFSLLQFRLHMFVDSFIHFLFLLSAFLCRFAKKKKWKYITLGSGRLSWEPQMHFSRRFLKCSRVVQLDFVWLLIRGNESSDDFVFRFDCWSILVHKQRRQWAPNETNEEICEWVGKETMNAFVPFLHFDTNVVSGSLVPVAVVVVIIIIISVIVIFPFIVWLWQMRLHFGPSKKERTRKKRTTSNATAKNVREIKISSVHRIAKKKRQQK